MHHVRGPKGYDDLKTVTAQDGSVKIWDTFRQAAVALGLCEGDQDSRQALLEAMTIKFGRSLRHFFVTMVVNGMIGDPKALWEEFTDELSEDREERPPDAKATPSMINKALLEIQQMFEDYGVLDMTQLYKLPQPDISQIERHQRVARELQEELDRIEAADELQPEDNVKLMNQGQRDVYQQILDSVTNNSGRLFAIDAPGGTGKTFLLSTLLNQVRKSGKIAIATAFTGNAAILLPGGRTLHSRLKVPVGDGLHDKTILPITNKKNGTRALLEETSLLIIDEVTMTEVNIFTAVDRTLREILDKTKPFGGLTVVVSGDWRQTLPVIERANRAQVVSETLKGRKMTSLWKKFEQFHLTENMRLINSGGGEEKDFAEYLLRVGDGKELPASEDEPLSGSEVKIHLPEVFRSTAKTDKEFCKEMYPNMQTIVANGLQSSSRDWYSWLMERAIICPTNADVNKINQILIKQFPGEVHTYR